MRPQDLALVEDEGAEAAERRRQPPDHRPDFRVADDGVDPRVRRHERRRREIHDDGTGSDPGQGLEVDPRRRADRDERAITVSGEGNGDRGDVRVASEPGDARVCHQLAEEAACRVTSDRRADDGLEPQTPERVRHVRDATRHDDQAVRELLLARDRQLRQAQEDQVEERIADTGDIDIHARASTGPIRSVRGRSKGARQVRSRSYNAISSYRAPVGLAGTAGFMWASVEQR